jgi:hypothetical protein
MKRLFRWLTLLVLVAIVAMLVWSPALQIDTVEYGPSGFIAQSEIQPLFDPFVGRSWIVTLLRTRFRGTWYRELPAADKIHIGFKGFRTLRVGVQAKKAWIRIGHAGSPMFAAADGTLLRSVLSDYLPPKADVLPVVSGIAKDDLMGEKLRSDQFEMIQTLLKGLDTRFPLQVWSIRLDPANTVVLQSAEHGPVYLGSRHKLNEKLDHLKLFLTQISTSPNVTISQIDLRAAKRVIVSYAAH